MSTAAARHKARQALKGLARWLRKRLKEGMSEETAERIAIKIDELLDLRQKAGNVKAAGRGGGEKLEYNDEMLIQTLADACGGNRNRNLW